MKTGSYLFEILSPIVFFNKNRLPVQGGFAYLASIRDMQNYNAKRTFTVKNEFFAL